MQNRDHASHETESSQCGFEARGGASLSQGPGDVLFRDG